MSITKSINQLTRIFDPHHVMTPLYDFPQTKPEWHSDSPSAPLPRSIPEAQGIPSSVLEVFVRALYQDPTLNMHNVLVVRHGNVILDFSFRGYQTNIWKYSYSASKSLVSLAIGVLLDRGQLKLSDKLESFLPASELNAIVRLKIKDITVETLLTMSTGTSFNEMGIATEDNWVRGFLNSTFKSGDALFEYNSMNTYMLSYIVQQVSGKSLSALLKEAFFEPMGIRNVHFEKCPMGIDIGGWGMYIRPEDFAKFGLLILQDGQWNGKQLISKQYLKKATSLQRKAPPSYGAFHYGYQMWVGRSRVTVLFNGMYGQNVLIDRANDLVIVSHAGNNEMFQQSTYFTYAARFLLQDRFPNALPDDPEARNKLVQTLAELQPHAPAPEKQPKKPSFFAHFLRHEEPKTPEPAYIKHTHDLCGKVWYPTSDHANCVGLFPRIFQVMQLRYTSGLESVSFSMEDKQLILNWKEREQTYRLPLGYGKPAISTLPFGNSGYLAGADFRFKHDEHDRLVLMIRMDLVELPYSRLITVRFSSDGTAILELSELPGSDFLLSLTASATEEFRNKPIIGSALAKFDIDYLEFLIQRVMEPRIKLTQAIPDRCSPPVDKQEKTE